MDSMTIALIMSQRASADEVRSALPDAPIVPHADRVPAPRTRATVAGALRHLADLVAPPVPAGQCGR